MNQDKIGKFISELRKGKNITQQELANKIGVTDRAISNWENGRRMPDYSILNVLCKELNVTINELLSGEKLKENEYQNKLEENIIKLTIDNKKKINKKLKLVYFLIGLFLIFGIAIFLFYNLYEIDVKYEKRTMKCSFKDNTLKYSITGTSLLNTYFTERTINNTKYKVFHSTINLYNKRHSHWEYSENVARVANNEDLLFGSNYYFDPEDNNQKVIVYYTNKSLNIIKKLNDEEFLKEIKKSYFMCRNEE